MEGAKQDWRERDFLTPKQIGEILQIGEDAVYTLVNAIPHVRIGKLYRVPTTAFLKWLKDNRKNGAYA